MLNHEAIELAANNILSPGSQAWLQFGPPELPRFFVDAKGPRITDTRGRSYIDLFNGSGAVILGHGYPDQIKYITANIQHGASVSFRHLEEVRLALLLQELVPFMDRLIFVKTGSECVHLALRIATKLTGRSRVISLGYHGWLLPFDMNGSPVPDFGAVAQDWDLDSAIQTIRTEAKNLAAVIVSPSPFATDMEFYRRLEKETREVGALFIMDEVKSGFRWAYPCLSAAAEIRPDFLCFSKALANGFALAALAGKEEWLTKPEIVSFFSTFACENVGLFAAVACLNALNAGAFNQFRNASTQLFNRLTDAFSGTEIQVVGVPTFFRLQFGEHINGTRIATELSARGILYHPKDEMIITASHDEPVLLNYIAENVIDVCRQAVASRLS